MASGDVFAHPEGDFRIVEGYGDLLRSAHHVGVSLDGEDSVFAPFIDEQMPDAAAAGYAKKTQLAVATLAPEVFQHGFRFVAGQPLGLRHILPPRPCHRPPHEDYGP